MKGKVFRNIVHAFGLVTTLIVLHMALYAGLCPATQYASDSDVDPRFAVAYMNEGDPFLVSWSDYQSNKEGVGGRLMTLADIDDITPASADLNITQSDGVVTIFNLADASDRSWSSYRIRSGNVEPVSFKFPQRYYPFVVVLAVFLFWMLKVFVERLLARKSHDGD